MVGIDVVSLAVIGHRHVRFLTRVASVEEQVWVHGSRRPDVALAMLWAAKEATYKALCVSEPFRPRDIAVQWSAGRRGEGQWGNRLVRLRADVTNARICVVAERISTSRFELRYEVLRFTAHRLVRPADESQAARHLARRLLDRAGFPDAEMSKLPDGRPYVTMQGKIALSLSHDHGWVAAAVLLPEAA